MSNRYRYYVLHRPKVILKKIKNYIDICLDFYAPSKPFPSSLICKKSTSPYQRPDEFHILIGATQVIEINVHILKRYFCKTLVDISNHRLWMTDFQRPFQHIYFNYFMQRINRYYLYWKNAWISAKISDFGITCSQLI